MATAKDVPPGGVGEIEATYKSGSYGGSVKKTITVDTNDPDNKRVRLTLTGTVIAAVTVTPRSINFKNVNKDETPEPIELRIKLQKGKSIRIEEVVSEHEAVIVKKQEEAVYLVSLKEKLPLGRLYGKIRIKTNSKEKHFKNMPVSVYAFIKGNVQISPRLVNFGQIQPGVPSTRDLKLTNTGEKSVSLIDVKAPVEEITTEVVTEIDGARYLIKVTYDPGERTRGGIAETLTIVAGDGDDEEVLQVPVRGTIYKKTPRPSGTNPPE